MALTRDPKGYYIALGIDETADADAIKAAYRNKAKRLHPDFNPSPIAAKQFHRLHEAYETLSDPAKRAAYDRPWRTESVKAANGSTAEGASEQVKRPDTQREEPRRETKTERKQENPRPQSPPRSDANIEPPAVCKCGRVTAQPRYLIFDLVWGRVSRVQRRGISGIFCRSCADRTAVRYSLLTWLAGWWAWPDGPKETIKALLNNIRGGRKPPERNARLLMRQARAFRARGEMELARNAAEQAIPFAVTPQMRHEVDSLLLSLSAHPARPLKDRWAKPGWAATVQVLPLAIIVGGLSMGATFVSPVRLSSMVKDMFVGDKPDSPPQPAAQSTTPVPAITTGRVYSVTAKQGNLRTGPGAAYQILSVLDQGTLVLVTETDPTGAWLRVATPDGASGFMSSSQVSPDVRMDALEDAGGFAKPPVRATPAP